MHVINIGEPDENFHHYYLLTLFLMKLLSFAAFYLIDNIDKISWLITITFLFISIVLFAFLFKIKRQTSHLIHGISFASFFEFLCYFSNIIIYYAIKDHHLEEANRYGLIFLILVILIINLIGNINLLYIMYEEKRDYLLSIIIIMMLSFIIQFKIIKLLL